MLMLLNPALVSVLWTVGFGAVDGTTKTSALDGSWTVVSIEHDKKKTMGKNLKQGDVFTVKGDTYRLNGLAHKEVGTLKTDATGAPATVDIDDGNKRGSLGIYKLDGTKLVFCMWPGERPTKFKSGPKAVLVEFERAK